MKHSVASLKLMKTEHDYKMDVSCELILHNDRLRAPRLRKIYSAAYKATGITDWTRLEGSLNSRSLRTRHE